MSPTGTPTVAVTGGLGAIGGEVVRWLVAAGVRPVVLDVHEGRSLVRAPVEAYEVVHADIRDEASLDAALAATGADVVVHLAAKIRQDAADPRAMVDLNVTGALHALESARRAGVARFVLMSSRAAYGSFTGPHGAPSYEPVPEEYRCAPAGLYGATKLLVEHVAVSYPAQVGPEVIVTRLAWTFGPGKVGNHGVYGIYSEMVEGALAGRSVSIPSGGPQPNDVLYNGEIGRALVHLALHPGPLPHRTFNIGSGRATTLDEFADAVRQVVPGAQISVGAGMGFEGFHDHGYGVLDISRLLSTGFPPPSDLVVQVEDYVRSVRAA